MREDRIADPRICVRPVADGIEVPNGAGGHLQEANGEQRHEPEHERVSVARQHPVVDRVLDHQRSRDRAGLPEQAGCNGADDTARLRSDDGAHETPRGAPPRVVFPHA